MTIVIRIGPRPRVTAASRRHESAIAKGGLDARARASGSTHRRSKHRKLQTDNPKHGQTTTSARAADRRWRSLPDLPDELLLDIAGMIIDKSDYWHNMQGFLHYRLICKKFEPLVSSTILSRSFLVLHQPSWPRCRQFVQIVKREHVGRYVRALTFKTGEYGSYHGSRASYDTSKTNRMCEATLLNSPNLVSLTLHLKQPLKIQAASNLKLKILTSMDLRFEDIPSLLTLLKACPSLRVLVVDFGSDDTSYWGGQESSWRWTADRAAAALKNCESKQLRSTIIGIADLTIYAPLTIEASQLLLSLPWRPQTFKSGFRQHSKAGWKRLRALFETNGPFFERLRYWKIGHYVEYDDRQRKAAEDMRTWVTTLPHLASVQTSFHTEKHDERLDSDLYYYPVDLNSGEFPDIR